MDSGKRRFLERPRQEWGEQTGPNPANAHDAAQLIPWLLGFRRLGVRYERRADLIQGLLHLACTLIRLNFLCAAGENGSWAGD